MSETPEQTIARVLRDNPELAEVRLCFPAHLAGACYARAMPSEAFAAGLVRRIEDAPWMTLADFDAAVSRRRAEQIAVGCGEDSASALRHLIVALSQARAAGRLA